MKAANRLTAMKVVHILVEPTTPTLEYPQFRKEIVAVDEAGGRTFFTMYSNNRGLLDRLKMEDEPPQKRGSQQ